MSGKIFRWLPCLFITVSLSAYSLSAMSAAEPLSESFIPAPETGAMLEPFTLEGRFSLTLNGISYTRKPQQFSGRISWRHAAGFDEWLLADPFGQGIARLTRRHGEGGNDSNDSFMLERAGGAENSAEYFADDLEKLEAEIGFPLPLAELPGWVRARPGAGAIVEPDARGRPLRARESGWLLMYRYANDEDPLPAALEASFEAVRLKLVIERQNAP